MERKYICIDCGKEFIINSSRNTHAKRCPSCNCTFEEIEKLYKSLYKMRRIVDKSE